MKRINSRISNVVAAGRRAQTLAAEADLAEKLPSGLLETLGSDLESLTVPETADAETSVRALTGKQSDACTRAFRRATAIRRIVVRQTRNLETRRGYGVGERLNQRTVRDVVHALRVIIARIEAAPEEAKAFGFGEAHLATLRTLLADVTSADSAQEQARIQRPLTTRDRNAAARRVSQAVGTIADLGTFEFADDDAKRSGFEALRAFGGSPAPAEAEKAEVKTSAEAAA